MKQPTKTPWLSIVSLGLLFIYGLYNLATNAADMTTGARTASIIGSVLLGALVIGFFIMYYLSQRKKK